MLVLPLSRCRRCAGPAADAQPRARGILYPSASRAPAPSRPAVLNRARFPVSRGRFIGFFVNSKNARHLPDARSPRPR